MSAVAPGITITFGTLTKAKKIALHIFWLEKAWTGSLLMPEYMLWRLVGLCWSARGLLNSYSLKA